MAGAKTATICRILRCFFGLPLYMGSIAAFHWPTAIVLVFCGILQWQANDPPQETCFSDVKLRYSGMLMTCRNRPLNCPHLVLNFSSVFLFLFIFSAFSFLAISSHTLSLRHFENLFTVYHLRQNPSQSPNPAATTQHTPTSSLPNTSVSTISQNLQQVLLCRQNPVGYSMSNTISPLLIRCFGGQSSLSFSLDLCVFLSKLF